ncbi:HTH-type transcriptional regulator CymR [Planctomycetes bacterium Pan216]|uniref:HTH-type transcriptional regulator CymR n=1 Tax=Kolteria novifilia TaxID=2527975 RepID=A0A518B3I8_9BACT|nr:HTH-type transcriptional regulator CymR [Planctomycetes bacterium Pan216]
MIVITRKVDYAILVLVDLMSRSEGGASTRELADRHKISRGFVSNIMKELGHENIVESQRGMHGGYRLARAPREITLSEIIYALEGTFRLMACANGQETSCDLFCVCPVKSPLQAVHDRINQVLDDVTLEELGGKATPLVSLTTE